MEIWRSTVDEDFSCSIHCESVGAVSEGLQLGSVQVCQAKGMHLTFNMPLSILAISSTSLCGMHMQGCFFMSSWLGHAEWELSTQAAESGFSIDVEVVPGLSFVFTVTKLHTKLQQGQARKGTYIWETKWICHPWQKFRMSTSIPEREVRNTQHWSVPMREQVWPLDLLCSQPVAN